MIQKSIFHTHYFVRFVAEVVIERERVTEIVGERDRDTEIVYEVEDVMERVKGRVVAMGVPEVVIQVVAERVIVRDCVTEVVPERVKGWVVGMAVMERVKGWVVGIAVLEVVIQGVTERVIERDFVKDVVTLVVGGEDGSIVGMEGGVIVLLRVIV